MDAETNVIGQPETLAWELDVTGRLHRIRLADSNGLAALYEAVVNAIQSVVENPPDRAPTVEVVIKSDVQKTLDGKQEASVIGFDIADNGAGFNDANLLSFRTPDSMNKAAKGGKGIGRLLWLRVFKTIRVVSEYYSTAIGTRREFVVTASGMIEYTSTPQPKIEWKTVVSLRSPELNYKESLQVTPKKLAELILAHTLQLFLGSNRPRVTIVDDASGERVDLSALLQSDLCNDIFEEPVEIDGEQFAVQHVLRSGRSNSRHEFVLCAAGREVQTCRLDEHIKALQSQPISVNDHPAKYTILVSGTFLDSLASQERQDLLWGSAQRKNGEALNAERICNALVANARKFLGERLKPLEDQTDNRIKAFLVANPYYSYLYKQAPDRFEHISPNATDDEIDVEFYKTEQDFGRSARQEMKDFLKDVNINTSLADRSANLLAIVSKVNHVGQSRLARHVAYRRAVIDFLAQNLEEAGGKHSYEEVLHAVLSPIDTNSDDDKTDANLWLVDERFSYHLYLSSDQAMQPLNPESGVPDVAIFDRASAFGDDKDSISSVILLELKRPGRDDYSFGVYGKDPIKQVREYAEELKSGKAEDSKGGSLVVKEPTPVFAYIIADLRASLLQLLKQYDCKVTADGDGFYLFHVGLSLYIEILPYRKLIRDAKKRNQLLFHKLGIPTTSW